MNSIQSRTAAPAPPSRPAASAAPGPVPAAPTGAGWYRREEAIMGTAITVELYADTRARADMATASVIAEMHRIDAAMSPHKPASELSRLNAAAADGPVRLSDEMYRLVERAIAFSRDSGGVFDITYAAAGRLYDYRAAVAPDDAALEAARPLVDWRHLQLDPAARTLRFARPGVRIDLGGFAKGHAVDTSTALLRRLGIRHAMVAAGGDSHVLGDRNGRPWTVAVRDPRREGEVVALLPLEDASVSTSGDYERFFERDGVRHHHLIDPRTGRSPSGVRSVTIIADDGLTSEAFSKIVFVLGVTDGLRYVNAHDGIDAIVVDADGVLHYSDGLAG